MRRILVLRGGALGDLIVTLPALAAVRRKWPQAFIELIGNTTAGALALGAGIVDRVESQHARAWQQVYQGVLDPAFRERLGSYDLIINFWPDPAAEIARHFPIHAQQQFVHAEPIPLIGPAARYFLTALGSLALGASEYCHPLRQPSPQTDLVALHPGSGSAGKNWPQGRWIELAAWLRNDLGLRVRFILGEAETAFAAPTSESWRGLPLGQLADRLAACRLYLGHDTGVSHLAAACCQSGLLLFGPTDPAIWAPPNPNFEILRSGPSLDDIPVETVKHRVAAMLADRK